MVSSANSSRLPASATVGSARAAATSAASHPRRGSVSLLRNSTKSPPASAAPWLHARPKPWFASLRRTRMPAMVGNAVRVSSVEPLSTTMTSWSTSRL
jgi:hypothetical protein